MWYGMVSPVDFTFSNPGILKYWWVKGIKYKVNKPHEKSPRSYF